MTGVYRGSGKCWAGLRGVHGGGVSGVRQVLRLASRRGEVGPQGGVRVGDSLLRLASGEDVGPQAGLRVTVSTYVCA